MKRRSILLVISLALLLSYCSPQGQGGTTDSVSLQTSGRVMVTSDPNSTATPTPFLPQGSSGSSAGNTSDQTQTTAVASTPAITATPSDLIHRLQRPTGQVNILIFGSDYRPDAGYRTDVMMLLSLYTKEGTASIVSFPRDLYINIPGWEMQRLNTAQQHGGFELTQKTFEDSFGVHPDHYIMTNFAGFKGIIDTLGGVDVSVAQSFSDKCDLPQAVNHYCGVNPGTVHMNGATALWYVRARYSTSDLDRTRRAQEVIQAMFQKLMSLNAIARGPELYSQFKSSVDTDLTLQDIITLLPMATKLADLSHVKRYSIGWTDVTSWITPEGADVLLPKTEQIFDNIISKADYDPNQQ